MKNTRSLSLLLLLLITSNLSHAQVTFAAKSPQLTEATGWDLDFSGKWIDNKNHISRRQTEGFGGRDDNFKWLQMATVMSGGKKYHVIIYQQVDGEYKYPLTEVDWMDYDQVYVAVFTQDEYDQIKSVANKKDGKDLKIKPKAQVVSARLNGAYSDAQALDLVQKVLSGDMSYSSSCFVINAQTVNGQDVFRFLLPGACLHDDLQKKYYEVKLDEFKKLLID